MLYIYIASLLFGGLFVGLSVVSGLVDSDVDMDKDIDVDFDSDIDVDVDGDIDFDADGDVDFDADGDMDFDKEFEFDKDIELDLDDHGTASDGGDVEINHKKKYRPYFSFKFYTFISAFFGLTGVVLTLLSSGEITTFVAAVMMGALSGFGITLSLHLADSAVGGSVSANAFSGTSATVVLPIQGGESGKVKFRFRGQVVEMRAQPYDADDEVVLDFGEPCFVIDVKDGVAQVVHADHLEKHST